VLRANHTQQRLKFWLGVDLPVHRVREIRTECRCRNEEHERGVQKLHFTSSISIRFVVCFVGLPQIGGPFNGTYVVTVMPQFGHFHFSAGYFGAFSSSCSVSSTSSSAMLVYNTTEKRG